MNRLGRGLAVTYFQALKLDIWLFIVPYYSNLIHYSLGSVWSPSDPHYPTAIAPYGIFWYSFYHLLMQSGWLMFGIYCWMLDTTLTIIVFCFQSFHYALAVSISSVAFFWFSPGDLLPFWLSVIGKEQPVMSVIAVATKLPWPAPAYVWSFILSTSLPENQGLALWRYLVLGLWMIHPFFYWLRSKL